jgi:hypothetical protein
LDCKDRTANLPICEVGTGFVDFDNDGLLDLQSAANGHIYTAIDTLPGEPKYKNRFCFFAIPHRHLKKLLAHLD